MQNKLKNMLPALAIAFTTLTSVVCAVDDMQVRNLENRVNALEQRRGANGMINPPARPVVRDGTDLWVQAEALFMHATEDGLAYGIKSDTAAFANGRVKNVGYDWDWGFRAGIGYNIPHDGWDVLLNWTWFQAHETKHKSTTAPEIVLVTEANPASTVLAAPFAKGKAHLHYNLLDLEMGREFFVSKWLTLRPFMGTRAAWLNRNFKTAYAGGIDIDGHSHNRFRGIGLRGGLDTQWGLGSGWSFFGDIALSLIYGTHRIHSHQDTDPGDVRIQHIHNSWNIVRPMLDLALGLRWDHLFSCDAYRIRFQLGWEQHTFFGFEKDLNFVNPLFPGKYTFNQGDLGLSGLSFQVRFDF